MTRTKPLIRWQGGKSRMLTHLLPLITPHLCYVEPFAGGLAVLLAKPPSKLEIINDLNGTLVALYRNVQFHLPALLTEIEFVLNSRQTLLDFVKQPGLTEIQQAARFLARNKFSFGADGHSFGVARTGSGISRGNIQEAMKNLNARLDRVTVENLSYEHCVKLYDSADAFFFLDPPYLHAKNRAYKGWTEEQMTGLRGVLDGVKGKWMLTVDGSPFNRELFKDCRIREIETRNQAVNVRLKGRQMFKEFIVTPG